MATGLQPFADMPGLENLQPNGCPTGELFRDMFSFMYDQVVVACNLAGGDQVEGLVALLETMQGQLDAISAKCEGIETDFAALQTQQAETNEKCEDLLERIEALENP